MHFCLLQGTSAKLGGQGGERVSLRLRQAKIEDDLFSSAAINTFLSNNPMQFLTVTSSREPGDECCTNKNKLKGEERKESARCWPSHVQQRCWSFTWLILALHEELSASCAHFTMMELSLRWGEALLYFSVMPYGMIKMTEKVIHIKHMSLWTRLLQVWSTGDGKGVLRIERKMPSSPAQQTGSCWAAIWMLNSEHTKNPDIYA